MHRFPQVVDEPRFKNFYESTNNGKAYSIWNLASNATETSGANCFPTSTDGKCIAAATFPGVLSSAQCVEANKWLCEASARADFIRY